MLNDLKAHFGANSGEEVPLFHKHAAMRFAHGVGNGGDIERLDRAQVDELDFNSLVRQFRYSLFAKLTMRLWETG